MSYLLLDVGNTRIKWCWREGGILSDCGHCPRNDYESVKSLGSLSISRMPARVFVCSVLGKNENHELNEQFDTAGFPERIWITRLKEAARGISTLYANPDTLGIDRYLAVCAAFEEFSCAAIVVDAGTATTIDAVSQQGVHLGGLIIPGLNTLTGSLGASVSRLGEIVYHRQNDEANGFQTTTAGCVNQGARYAWFGGISMAIDSMKENLPNSTRLILTGGDADTLKENLYKDALVRPNLVLEGLALQMGVA